MAPKKKSRGPAGGGGAKLEEFEVEWFGHPSTAKTVLVCVGLAMSVAVNFHLSMREGQQLYIEDSTSREGMQWYATPILHNRPNKIPWALCNKVKNEIFAMREREVYTPLSLPPLISLSPLLAWCVSSVRGS